MKGKMVTTVARAYADTCDRSILVALATAFKRSCIALIIRRVQQMLILYLKSMSDHELREIGLSRSQIELTVGRALT